MTRALQTARSEFLYGGHLQCLGSIAILGTVAVVFQAPFPWGLSVSTYAVSYAIYVYNRLLEVSGDASTNPARSAYIASHTRALWRAFAITSIILVVVVLATAALPGAIFVAMLFAFGLLYTNVFKSVTRFIPGFKTFYVASAFTVLVFLPYPYAGQQIPLGTLAPFAGWVFWNAAIMQILLDVKDMESDASAGLRTIPLLLGRKRTFQLLIALTVLAALPPLLWATRGSQLPPYTVSLAVAPLLSLLAFRSAWKGDYQAYLIESGKFICWPVLLAIGQVFTA